MPHRFKLLLLVTISLGKRSSYAIHEIPRLSSDSRFCQLVSKLLKQSNPPLSLFFATSYLRLFTPSNFPVEMQKMICQYAGAISEYPYAKLAFETSETEVIARVYKRKSHLIYLSKNKRAAIYKELLGIFDETQETGNGYLMIPLRFLLKSPTDKLDYLFHLEDQLPNFSFLVITKAGCIHYIRGSIEKIPIHHMRIYDFSEKNIDKPSDKISFCEGNKPLTFVVLLNSTPPILSIGKILKKNNKSIDIKRRYFSTSEWHKKCPHYLHNLHFIDDYHFVIMSYRPYIGSRIFLYSLYFPEPVSYISLNQKYDSLKKFSYDSFCVFAEMKPGMLLFSHTKKKFIHLSERKDLLPLMVLKNTRQLIMIEQFSSKEKRVKNYTEGRLLLCNLPRNQTPVIEHRFQVVQAEDKVEENSEICYKQLTDKLLFFCISTYQASKSDRNLLYWKGKVFKLVKSRLISYPL